MYFESVFGDCWDLGSKGAVPTVNPLGIRKTIIESGSDKLIILCADFSLRGKNDQDCPWGYMGQVRVYQDICDNLVQETQFCRKQYPQASIVWASHFPPRFEHNEVGPRLRLLSEDLLLAAADNEGIRIIFSGHTHISKAYLAWRSKAFVVCAGTAIAFGKGESNSFNAVTLVTNHHGLSSVTVMHHCWQDVKTTFEPDETIEITL